MGCPLFASLKYIKQVLCSWVRICVGVDDGVFNFGMMKQLYLFVVFPWISRLSLSYEQAMSSYFFQAILQIPQLE